LTRRGAWLAALLAGCASAPAVGEWTAAEPDAAGWLDGRPVLYGDVGRFLRTTDPEAFARALDGLVFERIAREEAAASGISVAPATLARDTTRRIREWEERLQRSAREELGGAVDPGTWLRRVAGITRDEFRAIVRRQAETELLQDRLLRFEQLRAARVEVSILVVGEESRARDLLTRARAGESFAALAREHSVHATKESGGRLDFPLLDADVSEPAVASALRRARPGDVVGPFAAAADGKPYFQLYRVEAVHAARELPYRALGAEIERSLEERPVSVGEYERWRRRAALRHGFVAAPPPQER